MNQHNVLLGETHVGRGVFANRSFQEGELVLKTGGIILPSRSIYTIQIDWNQHLEPDAPARFLNHSCEPNLGVKTNAFGMPDFCAMRDIRPDEHLTFDYAMTEYMLTEMETPNVNERLRCQCGARNCRGQIGCFIELPYKVKARYAGFIADYLLRTRPFSG